MENAANFNQESSVGGKEESTSFLVTDDEGLDPISETKNLG